MALTNWIHQRERGTAAGTLEWGQPGAAPIPKEAKNPRPSNRPPASSLSGVGGFQLVFRKRYLLLIAILVLLSNLVNTTGEFILGKTVAEHAEAAAGSAGDAKEVYIGEFYSNFYFWINLLGAVLQMFVVSRLIKYIGVGPSLFLLPAIALCGYTMLAFVPVLPFIRATKIFENSADYSIQNTARHSLFLNTAREEKYKAKAAIDTFFWRTGDALSGLLVFLGTQMAFGIRTFALVNSVLVLVWIGVVAAITKVRREKEQVVHEAA
jgi:AAA family ATP:ADP antiporter